MSTPLLTIVTMMLLQAATPTPQRTPPKAHAPVPPAPAPAVGPDVLAMQVMLDRAGFSPGVIDGHPGENTDKALAVGPKRPRLRCALFRPICPWPFRIFSA